MSFAVLASVLSSQNMWSAYCCACSGCLAMRARLLVWGVLCNSLFVAALSALFCKQRSGRSPNLTLTQRWLVHQP